MTDQYQVPEDITLEEKIEHLQSQLKPNLKANYELAKSIESIKALQPTYHPEKDKALREANENQIDSMERGLIKTKVMIDYWTKELAPLLDEKKLKDEKAAKSAPAQLAATEITEPAPNKNGTRATVKEKA